MLHGVGEARCLYLLQAVCLKADELHVIVSALEGGNFPNNERLHRFVCQRTHGRAHGEGNVNYSYRLATAHVDELVEIVKGLVG